MGWPQLRHNSPPGSLIKECLLDKCMHQFVLFSLSPPPLALDLVLSTDASLVGLESLWEEAPYQLFGNGSGFSRFFHSSAPSDLAEMQQYCGSCISQLVGGYQIRCLGSEDSWDRKFATLVQIDWMLCKRVDAGVHQFYGQLDMFTSWFNNPVEWLWLLWFGWHNLGFCIQCSYHHSQFVSVWSQKSLSLCVEIVTKSLWSRGISWQIASLNSAAKHHSTESGYQCQWHVYLLSPTVTDLAEYVFGLGSGSEMSSNGGGQLTWIFSFPRGEVLPPLFRFGFNLWEPMFYWSHLGSLILVCHGLSYLHVSTWEELIGF